MSVTIHPAGYAPDYESNAIPWVNWASENAGAILAALDLDHESTPWGELAAADLPGVLASLERLLADVPGRARRAPMVRTDAHTGRFLVCGTDDAAIVRRLKGLRAVLAWAAAHSTGVCWS